jgi:hypothetical protein
MPDAVNGQFARTPLPDLVSVPLELLRDERGLFLSALVTEGTPSTVILLRLSDGDLVPDVGDVVDSVDRYKYMGRFGMFRYFLQTEPLSNDE